MKMMEPLQVATYLLPAVKIGCDMDVDVESSEQQSGSSSSNVDSLGCVAVSDVNDNHETDGRPAGEGRLADSVFGDGATQAGNQVVGNEPASGIKARLHLLAPAFAPLTATRSFPLSLSGDCSHSRFAHAQLAGRLSAGSQRKLHKADDDDFDEDMQRLAASMHFDNESSDESDGETAAKGATIHGSACRKQSDCAVRKYTNSQLAVLAREHGDKQNCRRTASFPIAHSPVEGSSRHCSHHASHSSSLAGIPMEIVPNLFIGDETASFNEQMLRGLNVTHVVNVTKRIPNWHEKCKEQPLKYLQIPVNDHWSENLLPFLPKVVDFIDSARRQNCAAFIHCEAGVSRSATIIVAYVMQTFRMKLDDAYDMVRNVKSDICPNFAFMMQLKDFEKQLGLSANEPPV